MHSEQKTLGFIGSQLHLVINDVSGSTLDLIQDWSSDNAPDLFSFVPYTWNLKIMFHQFEMIWAANQHNWIDCSTKQQENGNIFVYFFFSISHNSLTFRAHSQMML